MRIPRLVGGAFAALAVVATGAVVTDLDPTVITQLSNPADGIWIPVDATGEVVRVDAGTGEVTTRVEVATDGSRLDLREGDDHLMVIDRSSGDVVAVDPALGRVDRRVSTGVDGVDVTDLAPEAVVLGSGRSVARVGAEVAAAESFQAPSVINSVALTGDGAAVGFDGGVAALAPGGDEVTELEDLRPSVVRVGEQVVYPDNRELRNLAGERVACLDETPSAGSQWAGDAGSRVAVADSEKGTTQVVDVEDGWCRTFRIVEPGTRLGTPALALGVVFVPEPRAGIVHIVDPVRRGTPVRAAVTFGGERLEVHTNDGIVVAHDPLGAVGAILDADGVERPIDTSTADQGISAVLGDSGAALQGDTTDEGGAGSGGGESTGTEESAGPEGPPAIDPSVLAAVVDNPPPEDDQPPAPTGELTAGFAFSTDVTTVGEVVFFIDESTGSPTSWLWDFGDGTGASGPSAEKSWDTPGTYPVTLFVEGGSERDQVSVPIVVVPAETELPPSADFGFSTTVVEVGRAIDFDDRSTGRVERRRWEFGDGTTSQQSSPSKAWNAPGRYTVTLTVANDLGSDSASIVVEVVARLEPPIAVIDAEVGILEAGEPLTLVGRSKGGPAELDWDFGDGSPSGKGPSVVHVFEEPGTYTVRLTATNDAGVSDTALVVEVVEPTVAPVARIATLPAIIEVGDEVTLTSLATNDPDTETWTFGDLTPPVEGTVVTHVWTLPGTYEVTLTVANEAGSATDSVAVTVLSELPPPVAGIIAPPESPRVGAQVLFLDGSTDATRWQWDFGDGSPPIEFPNPSHVFTTPGDKTVTLTVSNRNGTSTASVVVTVLPSLPVVDFFFAPTAPEVGQAVQFTDASTAATSWSWSFGDGTTSTQRNPIHTYLSQGPKSVTLRVGNGAGDTATLTRIVQVAPEAPKLTGISANPSSPEIGQLVTFTATATGVVDTYAWRVNDVPVPGSGPSITHTFANAGPAIVSVTAGGPSGTSSLSLPITVAQPPPPRISIQSVSPGAPEVGDIVTVVAAVNTSPPRSGPIDSWSINWGDGAGGGPVSTTATTATFTHAYTVDGTFAAVVRATGAGGDNTVTATISVSPPPPPVLSGIIVAPVTGTTGQPATFTPVLAGGPVSTYSWTVGGAPVGSGPALTQTFSPAGTYTVGLTVNGPGGSSSTSTEFVVVDPPTPATPVPDDPAPVAGQAVTFTSGQVGPGPISSWAWQINGTPIPGSGSSVTHTFPASGTYTITVTATGPSGATGTASLVGFDVAPAPPPPPVPDFSFAPNGLTVVFTDLSSPDVTAWTWDFGDGTPLVNGVPNPTHTYAGTNTYNVTLTVTSPGGTRAVTKPVTVTAPPPPTTSSPPPEP